MIELAQIDASIDITPQNIEEAQSEETDNARKAVVGLQKALNIRG
jgi:hypothetical protein